MNTHVADYLYMHQTGFSFQQGQSLFYLCCVKWSLPVIFYFLKIYRIIH